MKSSRLVSVIGIGGFVVFGCSSSSVPPPGTGGMLGGGGMAAGPGSGGGSGASLVTSSFSVSVIVSGATGRDRQKMNQVNSVQVTAAGAVSGDSAFTLPDFPKPDGYVFPLTPDGQIVLGDFSYGTTVESGKVTFSIAVKDGLLNTLASGSTDGMIKLGSTLEMAVTVNPVPSW